GEVCSKNTLGQGWVCGGSLLCSGTVASRTRTASFSRITLCWPGAAATASVASGLICQQPAACRPIGSARARSNFMVQILSPCDRLKSLEVPMNSSLKLAALAAVACAVPALAQTKAKAQNVPEIPYESVPNFLKLPPGLYLGEAMGVATN